MKKNYFFVIQIILFFCLMPCSALKSQCTAAGTVLATISGTGSLCPAPPGFITYLSYQLCPTAYQIDTCGGNANKYYTMESGSQLMFKPNKSAGVAMRAGATMTVVGGGIFITVYYEPGATIIGTVAATFTCSSI